MPPDAARTVSALCRSRSAARPYTSVVCCSCSRLIGPSPRRSPARRAERLDDRGRRRGAPFRVARRPRAPHRARAPRRRGASPAYRFDVRGLGREQLSSLCFRTGRAPSVSMLPALPRSRRFWSSISGPSSAAATNTPFAAFRSATRPCSYRIKQRRARPRRPPSARSCRFATARRAAAQRRLRARPRSLRTSSNSWAVATRRALALGDPVREGRASARRAPPFCAGGARGAGARGAFGKGPHARRDGPSSVASKRAARPLDSVASRAAAFARSARGPRARRRRWASPGGGGTAGSGVAMVQPLV